MAEERDFKGIWIPIEIWLDERLTALEKVILMEIDSLDVKEEGCYASNEYLAEFCQCSITKVSLAIKKLMIIGYIYQASFDGRYRYLKSRLSKSERQNYIKCNADFKKVKPNNIIENNKIENINNNIKESKEKKYFDDLELNDLFNDYLDSRKKLKKPATEHAIDLAVKFLNEQESDSVRKKIIENSILNGWTGLFPLKDKDKNEIANKEANREMTDDEIKELIEDIVDL